MKYKDWAKKNANKKRPGMHGVYDSYDMEDRIVVREVYIKGRRVMTLAPILPDVMLSDFKKKKVKERS
jgi:hypothetical protein